MAYFTIGAITVEIQSDSGASLTYERIGRVFRAYNGGLRRQVRAQKRIWQGDTPPLVEADADALTTAIGLGAVAIGGDWPGASVSCDVEILNDVPIKDEREAIDHRRILTLRCTEV